MGQNAMVRYDPAKNAFTMLALPVKMILRLVFRIKYIWVTPWFNV